MLCIHPNDLRAGGKPADEADSNSLTSYSQYFDNIPAAQNQRSLFVTLRQGYQSNKDTTGVNSKVFSPRYVMLTQEVKYIFKGIG